MPKYTVCLANGTALPLTFEADDTDADPDEDVTVFYLGNDVVAVVPKTCVVIASE